MPGSTTSTVSGLPSQPSLLHSSHALDASVPVLPPLDSVCVDVSHGLHQFSGNRFDAGPVCLASIVHACNYRVTVFSGEEITGDSSVLVSAEIHSVRPGSVLFVSRRAGAYGRLLLATYECMMMGGLSACDWLTPVMRGGWRLVPQINAREIADVS